jgi:hypothetical protein
MAHIIFVAYASPKKHAMIQQAVNEQLAYDRQGKLRRGKDRPVLSEVRLYDIRVKRQFIPEVMRDLNINGLAYDKNAKYARATKKGGWFSGYWIGHFGFLVRIGRRILRLKNPPAPAPEAERKLTLPGWHYAACVGLIDDMIDDDEDIL